ncbi:serine/threonine protein kinase [Nannizzia gypsea CBS 118893]|uniref:non-specific serine/threonine protein kinase n=1 Tax=Arthroderma gypseum (strain ATCC MYA-4604 / CBS 118893) TaxID=535722 RepID=E4V613_ARTGP|nr:serine/threonine protein kinase [Nannizzia gypsea CBS 118893]EFR05538.1 serine/threonine protein kinase [Nannizzia gypsea CBS 118893]
MALLMRRDLLLPRCFYLAVHRPRRSLWTSLWKPKPVPKLPEEPRSLPSSGFQMVDADQLVEEEELPGYKADRFYPVHLGDIFEERYQVLGKLGFGSSSTVWLARDLKDHQYVTLKVYVHTSAVYREITVYGNISPHIKAVKSHRERLNIRQLLDPFTHLILVHQAAQMSLRDMKTVFFPKGFAEEFVRGAIIELLQALDFLHRHAEVVHAAHVAGDVHSGNMLLGLWDNTLLKNLEDAELRAPVASKRGPHPGDIMPLEYRAPETLLYVTWSYPVDIWSVGLTAWDLLGLKRPFTAREEDGGVWMVGLAEIPEGWTLESLLERRLEDREGFMRFIRKALTWMPEQRATTRELLRDPWLLGSSWNMIIVSS